MDKKMSEDIRSKRILKVKVKTARGRTISSTRWLQRQLNDPYVKEAKAQGYRSRAAFKLVEIDDRFKILKKGMKVIDLGAAPGGWTQVAVSRVKSEDKNGGVVVGIDLQEIENIAGSTLIHGDFYDTDNQQKMLDILGGKADVIMSDMAAAACGNPDVDHLRIVALCEEVFEYAWDNLADNGVVIAKILRGGTEKELLTKIKSNFKIAKHFKPPASRDDSAEMYIIAIGYNGSSAKQ
jgi:23S rRNA (uridine2552-2'-O)-methyltransferase